MVAKATKASYAMGSVLHNRKLDTELRRVVLLAKLRPAVGVLLHGLACSDCCGADGASLRVL